MAKIYKFDGYIVVPNGEDIDIEEILKQYGHTFMFKSRCGCEEFEWDDDLEVNNVDATYWVADKLYNKLDYERVMTEWKNILERKGKACINCKHYLCKSGYCMINQDYRNDYCKCNNGKFEENKSIDND